MTAEQSGPPPGHVDQVADILHQVCDVVEQENMRPPPTTIAAIRRFNAVMAAYIAENHLPLSALDSWDPSVGGNGPEPEEPRYA